MRSNRKDEAASLVRALHPTGRMTCPVCKGPGEVTVELSTLQVEFKCTICRFAKIENKGDHHAKQGSSGTAPSERSH